MSKIKKIGELYRERFENASIEPPKECWDAISAALPPEQSQKRRVVPLWIPLGGVAAALALIFILNFDFTNPGYSEPVVNSPKIENPSETDPFLEEGQSSIIASKEKVPQERTFAVMDSKKVADKKSSSRLVDTPETVLQVLELKQGSVMLKEVGIKSTQEGLAKTFPQKKKIPELIFETKESLPLAFSEETRKKEPIPETKSRFSISPKAGAIYADQIAANNNSPTGSDVTMTYGVNLAYRISDNLRLRTGYGELDLQYRSQGMDFDSAVDYGFIGKPGNLPSPGEQASLEQEMAYVEIPLEMELKVIDSKLGLNLISGMSSFWLKDNSMSLKMDGTSYGQGKAGNLHELSFSANLGLGLSYELLQGMELNLEPIFKYQWNTYTNNPSLRPYILGIYSGIRFQF